MSENSEPKGLPLPEVKEGQFVQTRKDKKQRNQENLSLRMDLVNLVTK